MKANIIITAIICITALELLALSRGIDGILLTTAVGIIAGLAGLATKRPRVLERYG